MDQEEQGGKLKVYLLWDIPADYEGDTVEDVFESVAAAKRRAVTETEARYGKLSDTPYDGPLKWRVRDKREELEIHSREKHDGLVMTWRIDEREVQK